MWNPRSVALLAFVIALCFSEAKLESCANAGVTYCVRSNAMLEDCPDPCCTPDNCHTLMYYAENRTFATSDATFIFFPGEHQLLIVIEVDDVSNLILQGKATNSSNYPTVRCNSSIPAGLNFGYVTNLTIERLRVTECAHCNEKNSSCYAIEMYKITNLSVTTVVISNTTGVGLKMDNLYGNSIINATTVQRSTGIFGQNLALYCYNDTHYDNKSVSNVLVYNSTFQHGDLDSISMKESARLHASGVYIHIACDIRMNITLQNVSVKSNRVLGYASGGNIAIQYLSYSTLWLINISIIDCFIAYGYSGIGGGLYFNTFRIPGGIYDDAKLGKALGTDVNDNSTAPILTVIGTHFLENKSSYGAGVYIRFRETEWPMVGKVSFRHCVFEKQRLQSHASQHGGVAVHIRSFQLPVYVPHKRPLLEIEFSNCNFTDNTPNHNTSHTSLYASEAHNAVLYIQGIDNATFSGCMFVNNHCSGIVAIQSLLVLKGENTIHNNTGVRGAGMVLCSRSIIFLHKRSNLTISENTAKEFGGGIYVESECDQDLPHCFFQVNNTHKIFNDTHVSLINNRALAGEAIYGGMVDHCIIYMNITQNYTQDVAKNVFGHIFHVQSKGNSAISSDPSLVCFCSNETYDNNTCLNNRTINGTVIVPGSTIEVYVMLLGQRNSPAPGIVKTFIQCNSGNCSLNNKIKETEQDTTQCTKVEYEVYSGHENTSAILQLVVEGGSFEYSGERKQYAAAIKLTIQKCPLGSVINQRKGVCRYLLSPPDSQTYVTKWIESRSNPPVWIGYKTPMYPLPNTSQIIYHQFCPLGFCKEGRVVKINTTYNSFDQDVQCARHRTGLLCGQCKQNFSLGFGSSQCLDGCNTAHSYLQYLRVIGLMAVCGVAGVLLVVLLTLLNLTVAEGTLNGLIFYANIIQVNLDIFFPSDTHARPWTVFIAWLNLDFGVTVCFYDGMDAYIKTWLQFIFPLYLWIVSGGIVYFSRKSRKVAKLAGKNSVKVLATLFLLSFGKLIRTVIAAGFFTNVKSYDGTIYISVWLLDANVRYLYGKHITLFVAASVAAGVALLYAVTLTFIQCLRRAPNSRMCGWVVRLKPLLDAYTGPYKDRYHFWTGLLLLVRITLFTSFAMNFNNIPTLNFSLIIIVCAVLLVAIQPGIYRNPCIGYLESLMYLNLILFSSCMMFMLGKYTMYRTTAAYIFGGAALIKCIGIIVFHTYKHWVGTVQHGSWCQERLWPGRQGRVLVQPILVQKRDSDDSSEEDEKSNEGGASDGTWLTPNYREPLIVNDSL